jgi:hypothetical protein
MTPEEMCKLADEATPGPWTVEESICAVDTPDGRALVLMVDRQEPAQALRDACLIALAPDLARLCAELGEALAGVAILEMHSDFSDDENEELRKRAVTARSALAKLAELEAPTDVSR